MADTKADIKIPRSTWVDLYDETGIAVGTAVDIFNKGYDTCEIAIKATQPSEIMGVPLLAGAVGSYLHVTTGESGLWAYSRTGTTLSVQEA